MHTHFTYNLWKYLLAIVLSVFGWNILYTSTAYRSPDNLRVDVYVKSDSVSSDLLSASLETIRQEATPDMETTTGVVMMANDSDYYSAMQMSVYIAAQEGDIYIIPAADFKSYAAQGAFVDLTPYVESGALDVSGLDLSSGYVSIIEETDDATGQIIKQTEQKLLGIPAESLYGFMDAWNLDNRDMYLCVLVTNGNDENVVKFMNQMIKDMRADKPDWLKE